MNAAITNSSHAVLAEEVHASQVLAIVMGGVPCAAFSFIAVNVPIPGAQRLLFVLIPLTLVAAAMPWNGFHYFFTPAGVEIRTLGFRLRWISAADIRSYEVEPWNPLRGYGIRGIGSRKAYVWGNRGVRIITTDGEVFLGHENPEKLIRDLDLVTQRHTAQANGF